MDGNISSSQFMKIMYDWPENDVIKLLCAEPRLMTEEFSFAFALDSENCNCSLDWELPVSAVAADATISDTYLYKYHTLVTVGACPHVIYRLQNENCTDINKEEDMHNLSIDQMKDIVDKKCDSLPKEENSFTSIYCIHIAVLLGKRKIVEKIIKRWRKIGDEVKRSTLTKHHRFTPLHICAHLIHSKKHKKIFHLLLSAFPGEALQHVVNIVSYHSMPIIVIASKNDAELLASILKLNGEFRHIIYGYENTIRYTLETIVEHCALDCLKYFLNHLCHLISTRRSFLKLCCTRSYFGGSIDKIFVSSNVAMLKILLKIKEPVILSFCLSKAVYYDKPTLAMMILENHQKPLEEIDRNMPLAIQATLYNSPLMLQTLIKYNQDMNKECYGYRALDWAKTLKFHECIDVLKSTNALENPQCIRNNPPLVALFDFRSFHVNRSVTFHPTKYHVQLVKRLIELGHDINAENSNGITPLYNVAHSFNIEKSLKSLITTYMLLNGANPCSFRNSLGILYRENLVDCLLYANAQVSINSDHSILRHAADASDFKLIMFLLDTVHTFSNRDVQLLSNLTLKTTTPPEVIGKINTILFSPKSLLIICRNTLRRYFGFKIHSWISSIIIPQQIKELLLLREPLEKYGRNDIWNYTKHT